MIYVDARFEHTQVGCIVVDVCRCIAVERRSLSDQLWTWPFVLLSNDPEGVTLRYEFPLDLKVFVSAKELSAMPWVGDSLGAGLR